MHQVTSITPALAVNAPSDVATGQEAGFRLRRYRVTNFRSVTDSGYLDLDRVTALIGVNESGKTNLLLPLWKLNPAGDGAIDPTSDFPKALFGTIRQSPGAFPFVTAEFETGEAAAELAALGRIPEEAAAVVSVSRSYDGSYLVSFPLHRPRKTDDCTDVQKQVLETLERLSTYEETDGDLAAQAKEVLAEIRDELSGGAPLTANDLMRLRNRVGALVPEDAPDSGEGASPLVDDLRALRRGLGERMARILAPDPGQLDPVREFVLSRMPVFVYYSNYGNLDSEIYLPHVVDNIQRADLGAKEAAKARTLRVLFGFVGLEAAEILELGRDFRDIIEEAEAEALAREGKMGLVRSLVERARTQERGPDAAMLAQIAEAKRTRSILLQSASTKLTEHFGQWWKQGDYRFRFEADGNHFRIWVADARRPQEVELENRSTGLQWFLSFFLVFLHESRGAHRNAVLLLDEPGHSLHPLAQRDLSMFFEGLAATNQILYTTHSPFLVGADRLERARKVFVDRDGSTRVSGDLGSDEGTDTKRGAGFAVRAALSISVADAVLLGSAPVLVSSTTDQIYLSAIKTLLIRAGRLRPVRDIVFAPATGPGVMQSMAQLLAGEGTGMPPVIVGGHEGAFAEPALRDGTETAVPSEPVIRLDRVSGISGARIEDVIGAELLAPLVDRVERRPDRLFVDVLRPDVPLVPQVERWAEQEGIMLAPDWRRQLALRAKARLLEMAPDRIAAETMDLWGDLMDRVVRASDARSRCGG
ncbi:AAA family ATPase [Mameliella alba]|nr:AAA family ATPase [Mameliella alba]MBY6171715.1 AAA family ATPase [Mameliella alba]MBY6176940.1 AAA family ATPase [Mameliella alba]